MIQCIAAILLVVCLIQTLVHDYRIVSSRYKFEGIRHLVDRIEWMNASTIIAFIFTVTMLILEQKFYYLAFIGGVVMIIIRIHTFSTIKSMVPYDYKSAFPYRTAVNMMIISACSFSSCVVIALMIFSLGHYITINVI